VRVSSWSYHTTECIPEKWCHTFRTAEWGVMGCPPWCDKAQENEVHWGMWCTGMHSVVW